jgi:FOG: Ankyrin repeat
MSTSAVYEMGQGGERTLVAPDKGTWEDLFGCCGCREGWIQGWESFGHGCVCWIIGGQSEWKCRQSELSSEQNDGFDNDTNEIVNGYFQAILDGNMSGFVTCVKELTDKNMNVASHLDKNGASALHWAAGGGHLEMVQYLVKECNVPPDQPQKGKRSFRNRTPLHWAARNGHLNVVRYLLEDCCKTKHDYYVDIDAVTLDGTTAFCWACWQGHEEVMKYLHSKGANTSKLNKYGCNAVLWSAQSTSSGLNSLKWLHEIGSDMKVVNSNGHGMLHKSAQRGKEDVCRWILEEYFEKDGDFHGRLQQIGPDAEGFCPSDLAGVEGFEELAQWLTIREGSIALDAFRQRNCPEWLLEGISNARHAINRYGLDGIYESGSGVKKMSAFIIQKTGLQSTSLLLQTNKN